MRTLILIAFVICTPLLSVGQRIINDESTYFSLDSDDSKIEFLVINKDLSSAKPILLWFQGSQPYPLYINKNDELIFLGGGISNFNISEIQKYYHLVVISMPTVPVIANQTEINDYYWYYGSSDDINTPSIEFQRQDYLENYVSRAKVVLDFLQKQNWVDNSELLVAGHSQGARVATQFALEETVNTLALFSPNPLSRFSEMIRTSFNNAKSGKMTWEEADKEIKYFEDMGQWVKREKILKIIPH